MADAISCGVCGNAVPSQLVICPSCKGLVHRVRLEAIAAEAEQAARENEFAREASVWRQALPLLPQGSTQYSSVASRIASAVKKGGAQPRGKRTGIAASLSVIGVALLTKGKILLLGLTKLSTLLSMVAFLGVYWKAWGFSFAVAIIVTIYIHEIGHVAAMRRLGLAVSAPMFVPGLGAFVPLRDPVTPSENAQIGLAGPTWGAVVALVSMAVGAAFHSPFWQAVGHTTAWINLFNLTPVWQLDGSRGFSALGRLQRWIVLAVIVGAFALSGEKMLILLAIFAGWRAFEREVPINQNAAFAQYVVLVILLTAMVMFPQTA